MIDAPFQPAYGSTQSVTPAAASANVTIDAQKLTRQLRIWNSGANVAYVKVGAGSQTATTSDYPIAPGTITVISKDPQHDSLAHISPAGSTLIITLGEGY